MNPDYKELARFAAAKCFRKINQKLATITTVKPVPAV
jgi:hypothetical protein